MRILVCGGRNYSDRRRVDWVLGNFRTRMSAVITGDATGADALARDWCAERGVPLERFDADWRAHGRAAGPLRNQRMLDEGKPDLVLAFPGGRGTADMVRRADAAGVAVIAFGEPGIESDTPRRTP
jgi:hypothetical protein